MENIAAKIDQNCENDEKQTGILTPIMHSFYDTDLLHSRRFVTYTPRFWRKVLKLVAVFLYITLGSVSK